jgi:hypothetical protein
MENLENLESAPELSAPAPLPIPPRAADRIIASFDIGIKNMAYCIAAVNAQNQIHNILKWGIINMTHESGAGAEGGAAACAAPQCFFCKNRAKFTRQQKYYCKRHLSSAVGGGGAPRYLTAREYKTLGKKTVEKLREFINQNKIDISGFEASCAVARKRVTKPDLVRFVQDEIDRDFFLPIDSAGGARVGAAAGGEAASEIDLITVGRNMKSHLDEIFTPDLAAALTDVFIENQIGTIAMRMKTIQGMLTQYFIFVAPHTQIKYVSASLKLRDGGGPAAGGATTYKQRKAAGIEKTQKLLSESSHADVKKWKKFFEDYGAKRDDLADCFLQIVGVISSGGLGSAVAAAPAAAPATTAPAPATKPANGKRAYFARGAARWKHIVGVNGVK